MIGLHWGLSRSVVDHVPTVDVDFSDPSYVRDPAPTLRRLRELGSIIYDPRLGQYITCDHRTTARVIGDAKGFGNQEAFFLEAFGGRSVEIMDNPRHNEVRGIWAQRFMRDSLAEAEAHTRMIAKAVCAAMDPLVQTLRAGGSVDVVPSLSTIPTVVIANMFGLPEEMHQQFSEWSGEMGLHTEPEPASTERGRGLVARAKAGTTALTAYLVGVIDERRNAPGDDLISALVQSPVADSMSHQEIVASCTQLVFAGHETTAKLISHTVLLLAEHPSQRTALIGDRSLLPAAIEEVLRISSPVQAMWRYARPGARVGELQIPEGEKVMCSLAGANRDPERWSDPDSFDITREPKQHLGFGFGTHSCLGLNLARLEVTTWLNQLLDEVSDYQLDGEPDFGTNWVLRAPVRLRIAL
jgi:cytochrome P450